MTTQRISFASAWLALAAGAMLMASAAHATLPSVTPVIQYTGNIAAGGNGGYPPSGNSSLTFPTRVFVEDSGGYLYSSTDGGGGYTLATNYYGNSGQGSLFYRYSPTSGQQILERSIETGTLRPKQMTVASNGRLYSIEGTASNRGGLRRYTPGTGWELLAPMANYNLSSPWVEGADGRMFNTNAYLFFAVDKEGASGVQTILDVGSTVMGQSAIFLSHSNGRLYGGGRKLDSGAWHPLVFSLLPNGTDFQVHQTLIGDSGTFAGLQITGLVEAPDGRLYGSTRQGGANGTGVLFRLDADGSNYQVLHEFGSTTANIDGITPSSLVLGADGHVYGTAQSGGVNGNGVIFRWNTTSGAFEPLYAFNALTSHAAMGQNTGYNPDGKNPLGLMRASDGTLYGMAQLGGNHGWGTVFKFEPGNEVPEFKFEPVAKLSATGPTIAQGYTVKFSWSSQLAANCTASSTEPGSSWTGSRSTSSSGEDYTLTRLGTWTYTLTCDSTSTDFPDPVSSTYTIQVVSATPDAVSGGNGGGGALAWLLAPLTLLGLGQAWRRRSLPPSTRT